MPEHKVKNFAGIFLFPAKALAAADSGGFIDAADFAGAGLLGFAEAQVGLAANAADLVTRHALAVAAPVLAEEKRAATRAYLARQPFPLMLGAREALAHVSARGIGVAIVTGSNRSDVDATLRGHGLQETVTAVVSGDDVPRNKPAPDCYFLALRKLGARPEACVAVEDSEHGVLAAVSAGLCCVAVPNPMSRHQDFGRASAVVSNLAEAVRWIDAHFTSDRPGGPEAP